MKNKIIVPVIVTLVFLVLITLYGLLYFFVLDNLAIESIFKVVILIIMIAFGAVMIGVLVQRIKEIKGGEEDDISKY